jgi:hypothetical protein
MASKQWETKRQVTLNFNSGPLTPESRGVKKSGKCISTADNNFNQCGQNFLKYVSDNSN